MRLIATGIAAAALLAMAAPVSAQTYWDHGYPDQGYSGQDYSDQTDWSQGSQYAPQSDAYADSFGSGSMTDYPTHMPGDNSGNRLNREALPLAEGVTTYPAPSAPYSYQPYAPDAASYQPYAAPAPQPYAPMTAYPGVAPVPGAFSAPFPPPVYPPG